MAFKEKIKSEEYALFGIYFSSALGYMFALYNIYIGLFHGIAWNISMFAYYVCLASIRLFVAVCMQKKMNKEKSASGNVCFLFSSIFLVVLNVLAIAPIVLMCLFREAVNMSTIPAITVATYTCYKVVMAITKLIRIKNRENLYLIACDNVDFVDAMMSILTLQNTLILTFGTVTKGMVILCVVSSSLIVFVLVVLSLIALNFSKRCMFMEK